MSYDVLEKSYETLTDEQQLIVYNLVISLGKLNAKQDAKALKKRTFGKFAGRATATFSDDWEISEEELCSL
ncbi:MAG: hypothetical protein IKQ84_02835 [Spirochaetaceae bacterium]|nr:hypothetical protein [Spirochaetaceae bacterium]